MDRRTFLSWVGLGMIASSLPAAIAACSSQTVESNPSSPRGFQSVGTVADLEQKGQLLQENIEGQKILVIRNPTDSSAILAVNPKCPHEGCTVQWQGADKAYVCPCHNSRFSPDGKVIKGPAKAPLTTYETKIEGNTILVKVS